MTMTIEQIGAMMVEKWCRATFTDYKTLLRLIKAGIVRSYRKGDSRNSPLYYSKAEIKQAIINARLSRYITEDNIR